MNKKCPKCGTIPATGSLFCQYFDADQEPYENGKEEPLRSGEKEISGVDVHLSAQYCEKCEKFIYVEVSDAPMVEEHQDLKAENKRLREAMEDTLGNTIMSPASKRILKQALEATK